jgi:hypothetical protein
MRLFRRGRGRPAATDQHLTFLTREQASRLRALVQEAFAAQGRAVTVHGDHARDEQGMHFGLANVAAQCQAAPSEAEWPDIVAAHVRRLAAMAATDVLADVTPDRALAQTYAMLYAASPALNPESGYGYAREALPGLLEVLAFDSPDSFRLLTDGEVDRLGGVTTLREAGRANLRALPVESAERVAPAGGVEFDVLSGESVYTASRALVLSDTLGQLGQAAPRRGVLACLPSRHQLAVHPLGGDDPAIEPLSEMAHFAHAGYSQGIGRLSPHVYWWHDGGWEQVSTVRDGRVDLHLSSGLLAAPGPDAPPGPDHAPEPPAGHPA